MRTLEKVKHKKTLILGFGREGKSTYKFIRRKYPNSFLAISDQKELSNFNRKIVKRIRQDKNLKLHFGKNYLENINKYELIIKSPGIPYKLNEISKSVTSGIEITSHTNIFLEECPGKIIGITGTKGKSTTASLIYHIFQVSNIPSILLGNIGKPALDFLSSGDNNTYFVFEMSSHQLYDIVKSPHIAVLLNVYKEHLDYYRSFSEYKSAKGNITIFQSKKDVLVYNEDFKNIVEIASKSKAKKYSFSRNHKVKRGCYLNNGNIVYKDNKHNFCEFDVSGIRLRGKHNLVDVMSAITVAKILGVNFRKISSALKNFRPLEGRLEEVGVFKSVSFVCDTLATIPEATIAAINSFSNNKITLILGGYDRGISFDLLSKNLSGNKNILNVVLIGQVANKIKDSLEKYSYKGKIFNLGITTMEEVVKLSMRITPKKSVVLLSPATASFDMFKDYKDRGNQFKAAVKLLAKAS